MSDCKTCAGLEDLAGPDKPGYFPATCPRCYRDVWCKEAAPTWRKRLFGSERARVFIHLYPAGFFRAIVGRDGYLSVYL